MKHQRPRRRGPGRLSPPGLARFSLTAVLALLVTSCATMIADQTSEKPPNEQKGFQLFQRRF